MANVSLSTMWAQGRFHHLGDFVQAVRRLGFPRIEINYTVAPQGLDELLEAGDAIFPSLHAPVPRVKAANGRWSDELNLASLDEEERRLAVDLGHTTIDWAAKVGASCVVLHLGGVGSEALPPEKELRRLFDAGQANSYGASARGGFRADCHRLRTEGAPAHLAQARASLHELADHAAALGVALGLENRYHFHEIPNVDEMKLLLADYPPAVVGYWHDVGHAEVLDRLGLIDKHRWLRELGDRCL
ncbi:MAG: TIM barrel protein, partial [Chloroflexota bacterium]|nr:TIM barrel protein [Chloroflexota bacterium]